ncbi:hypothetical protein [Azospirillum picis]|uniref:Cation transporter n=1 Tax=Azospirillum picis TaxID=488438 RepID=A0ABU0MJJ7_9PROT|nr:hypothetical protein [Azospirillum picis]MBP2299841.1 hypothetical protein [Azospirillum picis]MDQ0533637.1 hypothetical protein [Azospirillum picis]
MRPLAGPCRFRASHTTGHHIRSDGSRHDLHIVWTMFDAVLNALLLLLVGLEATMVIS